MRPFSNLSNRASKDLRSELFLRVSQKSQEQIEFLAGRKRYKYLFKEMEGFRNTLNQTSTVLPEHERQRAARFIAASRSLGKLSKAVQSFMWNGQDEQLYNAADKLKQLLAHV